MRPARWRSLLLGAALVPAAPLAAQVAPAEEDEGGLEVRVSVQQEYDDNVNFADGSSRRKLDDYVTRIRPWLAYSAGNEGHRASLELSGDWREGFDTEISDFNGSAGGAIELSSDGGLHLRLADTFTHTRFDQAIFDEPGTTDSDSNLASVSARFQPAERFSLEGGFDRLWQDFHDRIATGGRTVDTVQGTLTVPVTRSVVAYGTGLYRQQDSPERPERRYDDRRLAGGLRFVGARRFTVYGEVGQEETRFDDPLQMDFDEIVARVGLAAELAEDSSVHGWVGRDGYGNTVFTAGFEHGRGEHRRIRALLSRATHNSFAVSSTSPLFETTLVSFEVSHALGEKLLLSGEIGFYLFDNVVDLPFIESRSGTGRVTLLYSIQQWLRVGGHYQVARRRSDDASSQYDLNRMGATVVLVF